MLSDAAAAAASICFSVGMAVSHLHYNGPQGEPQLIRALQLAVPFQIHCPFCPVPPSLPRDSMPSPWQAHDRSCRDPAFAADVIARLYHL
jgi:hypothetical protein